VKLKTEIDFSELHSSIDQTQTIGECGYEKAAMVLPPSLLIELHQWHVDTGMIALGSDGLIKLRESSSKLPLAIFTVINFGGAISQKLKGAFPDYAKHFRVK
jgi:hypothetical protein